ncbi:hypothetical protein BH10BDE1_BH10BDE1_17140 [soil metagenome]
MSSENRTAKRAKQISLRRNVPRLYVQAIFALAAALALTTSACGKSDSGGNAVPAQKATAPATTNTNTVGKVAGTGKAELDKTSSTSSSQKVQRGQDTVTGDVASATGTDQRKGLTEYTGPGEPDPLAELAEAKPEVRTAVKMTAPEPLEEESVVYYNQNGLTPDQIFAKKAAIRANGAFVGERVRSDIVSANGDALYYTGGGQDTLRDQLYVLVNENAQQVDAATRAGDKELAQTIQLSSFSVDWSRRRADLNFKFERIGSTGVPTMTRVHMEGPVDALTRFKVRDLKRAPYLEAEVACMDISGGCQTVHIKIKDSSTGRIQTAHMIARHTNASLYIDGNPQGVARNSEYDRLMTVLLNTANQPSGENVVDQLTMTTSETIGGASNFAVTMKMRLMDQYGRTGGDTVELSGPLAKPRGNDNPNVSVLVSPALTVINGEIVPTQAIGTQGRFVDTVREGRLVRNDGRGNLQLEMTVRAAAIDAKEDKIRLTISRIHTPTSGVRLSMQ